ncbi:MAG TPA: DNA alkylation repair protein [Propionibacteriaceae bacterium]|jgi:3-methyladenine DNA glycosylase AlkC|nr:DNA alkylation repair protein [Propionibacteriaceae bacterium]
MAEPLKNYYGPDVPARIARMIKEVDSGFDEDAFLADALDGYQALELTPRARQIAQALGRHLPQDYERAIEILIASLGPKLQAAELTGIDVFVYLPHVFFIAEFGVDHFEASMRAQYELTQRFSAEYSIRVFLERYLQQTLGRLHEWAFDSNVHVRRLVSEGTRPRLPWAPRLRAFQDDPRPVLELLELLKDDPDLFVRRSVANNLNDIGKDNPAALIETCRRWMKDASPQRSWLVRHALRSAVKRGEPEALEILGFLPATGVQVRDIHIAPAVASIGDSITFTVELSNDGSATKQLLIELRVHFVKANGKPSPKVFALKELVLRPNGSVQLSKTISLAQHTTRTHYPGQHRVEVLVNGRPSATSVFDIVAEGRIPTS